jgi:hypothetical protein
MLGKLSRLPAPLREQLNLRLANGDTGEAILSWLNALPEVQDILNTHFDGKPVTDGNISEYRQRGFRRWEMRQSALEFSAEAQADGPASNSVPSEPLVNHLVHWISIRFAAAAHTSTIADDPETELRQIRQFLADIVALRRGDLIARRIYLEQQRLSLEQTKNKETMETLFWEWTKRSDIQAKLYPHRDPDKMRRDVVRMLDRELLGVRNNNHHDDEPEIDPAVLI